MARLNMVQAINAALSQEMEKNPRLIVLGEDVGKNGGVFRVTEGLWQKFGGERVVDTPLAEVGIIGVSVGLALGGMRPVAEAQFDGFVIPMLDQLINHASRLRNRSRGRFTVPLVLRFPFGGGIRALEHHSDSPETHFVHTPGLKVVVPSTPYNAKGLMLAAIRDPDPVVFMEPKRVYRAIKEDVPDEEYVVPLGKARLTREGDDVTIITWGAMVRTCNEADDLLVQQGIGADVIDLQTLSPLDIETIIESVKKTGRVVIVHEAQKTLGFGAELVALINEKAFLYLKAPPVRVAGYDIITPLPKLENYYYPDAARIAAVAAEVVKF